MADSGDLALQIGAGISLFIAAVITVVGCVSSRCGKKKAVMKQSPSMEELNTITIEDPSTNT